MLHNTKLHNFFLTLWFSTQAFIIQPHHFDILSIYDLLKICPDIEYIKCQESQPFAYKPFPIARFPELQPNKGIFAEAFIAKIPNGQVCSWYGWIQKENHIVQEFIFPYAMLTGQEESIKKYFTGQNMKKIDGKVAVITMPFDHCYGHWMIHVLGRLALLESKNIAYDWLYIANARPFMKETLALWGIDPQKILIPDYNYYIQADELIVPSHIGARIPTEGQYILNEKSFECLYPYWGLPNKQQGSFSGVLPKDIPISDYFFSWTPLCGYYLSSWIVTYLQNKFLPCIANVSQNFSKKVFISRKDSSRNMINEDEIFLLFERYGFTRYLLSAMSLQEQIKLFYDAEIIVGTNGSSLTNLIFCKPNTNVVEIFLARSDSTFYYSSDILKLNHYCIKTIDFKDIDGNENTTVDSNMIQKFIDENQQLFNS